MIRGKRKMGKRRKKGEKEGGKEREKLLWGRIKTNSYTYIYFIFIFSPNVYDFLERKNIYPCYNIVIILFKC